MTAPATDSLSGIVGRLTKAQRRFIAEPFPNEGGKIEGWEPGILNGAEQAMVERLVLKNLVYRHHYVGHGPRIRITPLGLAIKQHMEKES